MTQSAITFDDLALGYNARPAVFGLCSAFAAGSLTAIVGPNGAGKSTLLKGIAGLLSPLSGHLQVDGKQRRRVAYLPQQAEIDLSFPITVQDLIAMGLWHEIGPFGTMSQGGRARVASAIEDVGLTGLEDRMIGALSGGQFQRALFARVIVQGSPLVLLDEPFNSVDERTISDLLAIVARWHGEGRTVLAVIHDYDIVRAHFPETLMLARELIGHGATSQVLTPDNQALARQMCEACFGPPHVCGREA